MDKLIALIKFYKKTSIGIGAIFAAGTSFGGYALYAEQSHAQTAVNKTQAEANAESIKLLLQIKEVELAEKTAEYNLMKSLCISGEVKNVEKCAAVHEEVRD